MTCAKCSRQIVSFHVLEMKPGVLRHVAYVVHAHAFNGVRWTCNLSREQMYAMQKQEVVEKLKGAHNG